MKSDITPARFIAALVLALIFSFVVMLADAHMREQALCERAKSQGLSCDWGKGESGQVPVRGGEEQ